MEIGSFASDDELYNIGIQALINNIGLNNVERFIKYVRENRINLNQFNKHKDIESEIRKELYTKDRFYISYTNNDICFESIDTAESIMIDNDGIILQTNYDSALNKFFLNWYNEIYSLVEKFREIDRFKETI